MFVSDGTLWYSSDIILVRMVGCQVVVSEHCLRVGRMVRYCCLRMGRVVRYCSMMRVVGDSSMS